MTSMGKYQQHAHWIEYLGKILTLRKVLSNGLARSIKIYYSLHQANEENGRGLNKLLFSLF